MTLIDIEKSYEHNEYEKKWYDFWEKNNFFKANHDASGEPFCIVIPPPNVTGTLHIGHALNNTLQDIVIRYKKMRGFNVLWQPGTDHAGIATQNVVEKNLASKGENRHDIGREKFIEIVWEWKKQYGGYIVNQLKRLGCACDWSRERFTMDEGLSRAVKEVFVSLYKDGLIYRGDYIINWCPRCMTAIADIEVEYEAKNGFLYHIRYPLESEDNYIVIATTRPETLLGDTAVAVNPEDERYIHLKGKKIILPIVNRIIPVIFDKYVEMAFGTGALKVTPAHDLNDFGIGETHGLERIKVIDENGSMNEYAGPYAGMDRFDCREKIVRDLEEKGFLEKKEPYNNSTGHCYRCNTMIEPLLSKQWFVKTAPLAEKAVKAVKDSRTCIIPQQWENVYYDWMNNIRDWCISRQIWWGHRIPAWYCDKCGQIMVSIEAPEKCNCGCASLRQEEDVLDTWFSSALWPFSTLGWPDKTPELQVYYPNALLITGFDILFFWVARMMMMGIYFMGDVPFKEVYIHALVRDAQGQKMSKSKGNVIDPLETIDKFGTDAFRFTLAALAVQGRDVKLSEERIQGYRHFVNKIWNAARFVLMNVDENFKLIPIEQRPLTTTDKWILTRMGQVSADVAKAIEEYRFNDAATYAYKFVWHEFCDWYVEIAKLAFYGNDTHIKQSAISVAIDVLSGSLRLIHPFMPFITEEIWHKLPEHEGSIMTSLFPCQEKWPEYTNSIEKMELLMGIISGIRNIRGEMNIPPSKKVKIVIDVPVTGDIEFLKNEIEHIKVFTKADDIIIGVGLEKPRGSATSVFNNIQSYVCLKGLLDFEEERKRLQKELQKAEKELITVDKKLSNPDFIKKAPEEVIEEVRLKQENLQGKKEKLSNNLQMLDEIGGS